VGIETRFALICSALLLALLACSKGLQQSVSQAPPASTIATADPQHASQLVRGFYPIEQSWRWTQRTFVVRLAAPKDAAQKGAQLQFRFTVPEPVIQTLKSVTLSAAVNGFPLNPQTYGKAGQYTYSREVPPERLQADTSTVEFALDRALPPGPVDKRELGVVVNEVGLTS
jgi:hypothetical protein